MEESTMDPAVAAEPGASIEAPCVELVVWEALPSGGKELASYIRQLHADLAATRDEVDTLRHELEATRLSACAAQFAARHDPLTGLPNRLAFSEFGHELLQRPLDGPAACAVIDLDGFKQINDGLGHAVGDEVLVNVANRLSTYAGDEQIVARIGGDEFVGLLASPTANRGWREIATARLAKVFATPVQVAGRHISVTASIGWTSVCAPADIGEVLRQADEAMYWAKNNMSGTGSRTAWFDAILTDNARAHTSAQFSRDARDRCHTPVDDAAWPDRHLGAAARYAPRSLADAAPYAEAGRC
jgi:diguanylate cyclase (GGDEF)-like protein